MAKRKQQKKLPEAMKEPPPAPPKWRYTGPPYRRVSLEGVPIFDPATITQARIGHLMARYPAKLANYFATNERVKPGIDSEAEGLHEEE